MNHPTLSSRHITGDHCSHLRHKGMYVFAELTPEAAEYREDFDATAFWCVCTQRAFGPDGEPVSAEQCGSARGCCER